MTFDQMTPRGQRLFKRCKEQLGYNLFREQPHCEMLDYYARCMSPGRVDKQKRSILLVPRDCFKTTGCTVGGTVDGLSEDPNLRYLIAAHSHQYATEILSEIKWQFEWNEGLRSEMGLQGDARKWGSKWAEESITLPTRTVVKKEATIATCGLDNPKVGGHYDRIVIDDIHTSENLTPKLLRKAQRFVRLLLPVLEPGGVLFIVGTRWHYDDIFGWLLELNDSLAKAGHTDELFETMIKGCYDGPGGLYFPSRLTESFLESQRLAMTDKEFSCQYLNKPISDEAALFSPSLIKTFDGDFVAEDGVTPYVRMKAAA